MIQESHEVELFKLQLRNALNQETKNSRAIEVARNTNVYSCGEQGDVIYFIESGRIKLVMLAPDGKECILAIHTSGDVFGEICLSGTGQRAETATALADTRLKLIPSSKFFARLTSDSLLKGFVQYLTVRIADQQQVIANLVTVDSEQRLGKTLLQLARRLGKKDPRSIRIEHRFTHEELASMVGTTQSRISTFMHRYMELGLIELTEEHYLIIKEKDLSAYLDKLVG